MSGTGTQEVTDDAVEAIAPGAVEADPSNQSDHFRGMIHDAIASHVESHHKPEEPVVHSHEEADTDAPAGEGSGDESPHEESRDESPDRGPWTHRRILGKAN